MSASGAVCRVAEQSQCDVGVDLDTWLQRFADAYNTVEHPDRPEWDILDLHNVLREATRRRPLRVGTRASDAMAH